MYTNHRYKLYQARKAGVKTLVRPLPSLCSYTVKKVRKFPVPSRDVTTKLSLGGNNDNITELFLPRGSLVSDITAGDGKLVNLFLLCTHKTNLSAYSITMYSLPGFVHSRWGGGGGRGLTQREGMGLLEYQAMPSLPDVQ